jgi:bacterioferritin-associated ferredoxin
MVVFYEFYDASEMEAAVLPCSDPIICHCLQICESTVREAAAACPFRSLAEVGRETGAGTGCTACHRRLRGLINSLR